MFKFKRQFVGIIPILLLLLLFSVSVIQTQDETPSDTPILEPTETLVTPSPTLVPTHTATLMPTVLATELPTEMPLVTATLVVTEAEATPTLTLITETVAESTAEVSIDAPLDPISGTESTTPDAPIIIVTEAVTVTEVESTPEIPDEPPMQLLIRELFNNGDVSAWSVPSGWSLVDSQGGQALQVINSSEALILQKGMFHNVAVQARFLVTAGTTAQLQIQRGEGSTFTAALDSNGLVTLSHNDAILQSLTLELEDAEFGHQLRLSLVDGIVRVALDSSEVITWVDNRALNAGSITISATSTDEENPIETNLLMDDFFLWVPQTEADRYPSPTPMAVVVVSTPLPTPVPSEKVLVEVIETADTVARDVVIPLALPDAPLLKAPADGSITSKTQEKFSWSTSKNTSYLVDIDDDSDFSSPLYEDSPATKQFVPPTSLAQGTYYWRVQAQNTDGISGESEVWSFTVNILLSPKDGSTIFMKGSATTGKASLKWSKVTGATNFMLYLYEDLTCTSLLSGFPLDMGTSTSANQELDKGQYCWKVEAVGVDGGIPPVFSTFIVSPPAPDAPDLVSPANKGATNDTTPSLDWDEVTDADQYMLEWSTDKRFASDVESTVVNAPTTEFTLPTLPDTEGTVYYWRMGTVNDLGVVGKVGKPFSFTLDTEAPDAPELKSPTDGSTTSNPLQTLSWQAASGASSYLVDVDDNSDFSSPLYENSPASKVFSAPSSLPQATYFWRVQAQDAAGNVSGESEEWSFTVNILLSPTDGSTIFMKGSATSGSASLKWSKVTGATGYLLYLYEDLTCTSLLSGFPLDMGTSTSSKQELDKGQYCWKVEAVGVDGGIPPIFSTFIVSPPAPDAPDLVSPANKSITNDTTPSLDWDEVLDADQYMVEWSTDKGFKSDVESTLVNAPTTEFTLPTLPDTEGTTYYWRVGSMNDLGVVGKVGKPFTFTLDTLPPEAPTLTSPADASTTTSSLPKFSWSKVSDAAEYEISLDTVDPPVVSDTPSSTQYTPPSPLLLTTYYWRVRAVDKAGNVSAWSDAGDPWEVTIESAHLAPPRAESLCTRKSRADESSSNLMLDSHQLGGWL